MKIAFINPSLRPDATKRFLPVGLAYVMTAAKKAGYDFDFIDMDIDKMSMLDLREKLLRKSYDVYALGCIVTGFKYAYEIFTIIRETNPKGVIVAGNSLATSIPKILLERTEADIAVLGEADLTIVELLECLENKGDISNIKGIAYQNKDGDTVFTKPRKVIKQIDEFGFPDFEMFDLDEYKKYVTSIDEETGEPIVAFPLNAARGCPFNCTFCYHVFQDVQYRKYSSESVKVEIERLHSLYGANKIIFWDELTFPNLNSVKTTVEMVKSLDFKIKWQATTRSDLFKMEDVALIKEMKESGCLRCGGSLENGDPEILKSMKKKLDIDQFKENAKALTAGGVPLITGVIFGYPQETQDTIKATLDICRECRIFPSAGYLLPLPGTEVYESAKKEGLIKDEFEYLMKIDDRQDLHVNLTKMSDKEFIQAVEIGMEDLAKQLELNLDSVIKTKGYQEVKALKPEIETG
jgi:anaerobic magnesium-protoporphyrin IX monomethyl ester cyclase